MSTSYTQTYDLANELELACWYVVEGGDGEANAVEPQPHGITIPDEVLEWAAGHGFSPENPDAYLLVAPADEAEDVTGEAACQTFPMSASDMARLRAALAQELEERAARRADSSYC